MNLSTLPRYLLGQRQAILEVAASRHAVWLGALLVLSAALAREYDGEDLLSEPWHLAIPWGASLATSFVLYSLVFGVAKLRRVQEMPFWSTYAAFLGLYWMTAPLAWLYAIPFERILPAGDATRANLFLLAVVSFWRVALITRVISVIFNCRFIAALPLVMLFADGVALFILFGTRLPIFSVMGGIRYTESERILLDVVMMARIIAALSLPVWLIGAAIVAFRRSQNWLLSPNLASRGGKVSWSLWIIACGAVIGWFFVLPWTQGEQQLRTQVERDLRSGRLREAVAEMARHAQSDFPPYWNPPPEVGYGEYEPRPEDVLRVVSELNAPEWIRHLYEEKVGDGRFER